MLLFGLLGVENTFNSFVWGIIVVVEYFTEKVLIRLIIHLMMLSANLSQLSYLELSLSVVQSWDSAFLSNQGTTTKL